MPYSAEHKKQSREKILHSAVRLFSQQGYENTSIDEIMQDAELTRGAFYAHFSSKGELYQQALIAGALKSPLLWPKPKEYTDRKWLNTLLNSYLSEEHINQQRPSCPLAFMVTDVAVSEPEVRQTYTEIFRRMNRLIARLSPSARENRNADIYAAQAMMIGAVAIGRCLMDEPLRRELLNSCERISRKLISGSATAARQAKS